MEEGVPVYLLKNEAAKPGKMTYEDFYSAYYGSVLRYLSGKCAQKETAEDLASQVFLYCYQNYDRYDPEKASMASWVYMVANSRLKNYWRDRKAYVDLEEVKDFIPDERDTLDSAILLDELRDDMADALEKLPERQRIIVVLRYFKDMSAVDIGKMLNMSPVNVRVQLSRALDKLEKELTEYR